MTESLDPELREILEGLRRGREHAHEATIDELRASHDVETEQLCGTGERVRETRDAVVPTPDGGVRVRLYQPLTASPRMALAYFHGGGWAIGSIESFDAACRALANAAGAVVASVDYRLAPEHRFPAALEDCLAATRWLVATAPDLGVTSRCVGVAGDSAGGGLAAVVARRLRDEEAVELGCQLLIYPACDALQATDSNSEFATGFGLTKAAMRRYWDLYLDGAPATHPDVSPSYADDLAGLPPAFIVTAGCDVLRDEGEAYGRALEAAGVPVWLRRHEEAIHGFWRWQEASSLARRAVAEVGHALSATVAWGDR